MFISIIILSIIIAPAVSARPTYEVKDINNYFQYLGQSIERNGNEILEYIRTDIEEKIHMKLKYDSKAIYS